MGLYASQVESVLKLPDYNSNNNNSNYNNGHPIQYANYMVNYSNNPNAGSEHQGLGSSYGVSQMAGLHGRGHMVQQQQHMGHPWRIWAAAATTIWASVADMGSSSSSTWGICVGIVLLVVASGTS